MSKYSNEFKLEVINYYKVLNCSYLAMVVEERRSNKNRIIEKRRNLLYNRLCN